MGAIFANVRARLRCGASLWMETSISHFDSPTLQSQAGQLGPGNALTPCSMPGMIVSSTLLDSFWRGVAA